MLTRSDSHCSFRCLTVLVWLVACSADAIADEPSTPRRLSLPETPYNYTNLPLPKHVSDVVDRFDNTPADNPITDEGATLGRVLFYDPQLSVNGKTSCASCHRQELAFTDDRKVSVGFDGRKVDRNSMSLVNLRYYRRGKFFWDERANSLEEQVLIPIENDIEMGHDLSKLVLQLQSDPLYPPLFRAAFGDEVVDKNRMAKALAQFLRSIVSFRSRYDVGREQVASVHDPFPNFSEEENYGKQQFFGRGRCFECHLSDDLPAENPERQSAFFYIETPVVNGIDSDVPGADLGTAKITKNDRDRGRFKSPSLRNVEVTVPYMHDGRFITLDSVVEHYNWSVRPHPNLDPRLDDFAANGMALPEVEKVALTAFLLTLTDRELLQDPRYSDPFESPPNQQPNEN